MDSVLFRKRLAEALSRNGMSDRSVGAEVLFLMPEQFIDRYEELWVRTWNIGRAQWVGDGNAEAPVTTRVRTKTSQTETRGPAKVSKGVPVSKGLGVADARAQLVKEWTDRQLRDLARKIRARMEGSEIAIRRCTGIRCRRLAEATWNWCPFCGSRTEEEN